MGQSSKILLGKAKDEASLSFMLCPASRFSLTAGWVWAWVINQLS